MKLLFISCIFSFCLSLNANVSIGSPLTPSATKVLLCGGGELGKELVIELQRFGVEVIVLDRYDNAPAMQVAHRSHTLSMLDGNALRTIIELEQPNIIVPEIEAIDTQTLLELESEGYTVIPTARAVHITMNRERIRQLAHDLQLKTSAFKFAHSYDEYLSAVDKLGFPCVVKPTMSSSGKGQSIIHNKHEIDPAWNFAQTGGRAQTNSVIVEEFIPFDYEITLLTVRDAQGNTHFCEPIGHKQIDGDYRSSWQPQPMSNNLLDQAKNYAKTITDALGGRGIFGVELFVKGDEIYFNEVSPRPHDTGMVTLISQNSSEFGLHARALLGLPIGTIKHYGPSASCAVLVHGNSENVQFSNLDTALSIPDSQLRLFGKPNVHGQRRMGVVLAQGETIEQALERAQIVASRLSISL
ncbi:MAG: Phosphoribosylglycinamide formyltransferase 2 [Candidatus Dependentiae bacterium ADurb.Bin331]|nr:MAG: Phosphoribosylglycinamide formyltransferase 2 [Candidatus Dependentiae bacterium ADurb.Bin331]